MLTGRFSHSGEKELARLQAKLQATVEDFKEVVNYFQYTGEGEEVMYLVSLTLPHGSFESSVPYLLGLPSPEVRNPTRRPEDYTAVLLNVVVVVVVVIVVVVVVVGVVVVVVVVH